MRAEGWLGLSTRIARLLARSDIQERVARWPFTFGMARRDGREIFDILQGFVASQVLLALVETGVLRHLLDGPATADRLALSTGLTSERLEVLLRAGQALGLLKRRAKGRYGLSRKGAVILGVPGLEAMIRHNRALYADMADPVALMRGGAETHLQRFWPYVFGGGEVGADSAAEYSDLMAQSQRLVALDTLRMLPLRGVRNLMDVGGGSGVFLAEALRAWPEMRGTLVDLPAVIPAAEARLSEAGLAGRASLSPGNFRLDPLPEGADAVSLVRVLYDHADDTVADLLAKIHAGLPKGGRLIVSEPMSGGTRPDRATDVYFAFYTMAMGTGRVRSAARIAEMCRAAGFGKIRIARAPRPYITCALEAVREN